MTRSITTLPANADRVQLQVDEVTRFLEELEREQRPLSGRLFHVMDARVSVLEHLQVVHPSISGTWRDRLTKAAYRASRLAD